MSTRISRPLAAALLAGGVSVLASACSSGGTSSAATSSATTYRAAASASPSATGPAEAALAAYTAMWADITAASHTSDYQAADLTDHMTGAALHTVVANMAANDKQGIVATGAPVLHPSVISASPTVVELRDCVSDIDWLQVWATSHKPVNDVPGGYRYSTSTVTDENGTWKVTQIDTRADGTCTPT